MALSSVALLSPEMLRAYANDYKQMYPSTLAHLLTNDSKMFYCPTCDQMVTITKPIAQFLAKPWRSDVFKWKRA